MLFVDAASPAGNLISEDITPPWAGMHFYPRNEILCFGRSSNLWIKDVESAAEIISKLDQLLNRELVAPRTEPSIIDNLMTARHVLEEADDFFRVEPGKNVRYHSEAIGLDFMI